jgi:hypothetical protein
MAARQGYKIVGDDMMSFCGNVTWKVGEEQRLPDGEEPAMCQRGFHFCPLAGDCLKYVDWQGCYRLLHVRVPDDATVIVDVDEDGDKCCASALVVIADITDTGGLQLVRRTLTDGRGVVQVGGINADRETCWVAREPNGACSKQYGTATFVVRRARGANIVVNGCVVLPAGSDAWRKQNDLLDRIEPFEEPLPE